VKRGQEGRRGYARKRSLRGTHQPHIRVGQKEQTCVHARKDWRNGIRAGFYMTGTGYLECFQKSTVNPARGNEKGRLLTMTLKVVTTECLFDAAIRRLTGWVGSKSGRGGGRRPRRFNEGCVRREGFPAGGRGEPIIEASVQNPSETR